MPDNWKAHIEKKYAKEGYMDKYGGSVLLTGITLGIFGMLFGYHYMMTDIKALKKDWPNVRCNPLAMPFAGIINAPPDGSKWEYTAENFGHCLTGILRDVVNVEKVGINAAQSFMQKTVSGISSAIQDARKLLASIRNIAGGLFSSIFGKILNVLMPLRLVLIKSLDSLNKVGGVGVTGLFTALGGLLSINGFVFLFLVVVIAVLIFVAVFIVAMLLMAFSEMFPFFFLAIPEFVLALAGLVFLIAILVLFIPVIYIILNVLLLTRTVPQHRRRLVAVNQKTKQMGGEGFQSRLPRRHFCFDGNTRIFVKGRGAVKIRNIHVGDTLSNGGKVTSCFNLSCTKEKMYDINGVLVTGKHRIDDPIYGCIPVKDHPKSKLLKDYRSASLFCINTTTKRIPVRNMIFFDYDELDDMDLATLRHMIEELPNERGSTYIHKFLEPGLLADTKIELEDGRSVKISDIQINDQLRFGERVLGIVKINGYSVASTKIYNLDDTKLIGTNNLKMLSKDSGVIELCKFDNQEIDNQKFLYNLITDTGTFMVNNIKLLDYHGGIQSLLWNAKFSNESLTA